ncbi:hypothetical protein MKX08_004261 [Trichoderma sp. CBMAI-0020]|nr:hypothetical protein MKX08_004261 [Trichoderma sp. CBMAI-0020]
MIEAWASYVWSAKLVFCELLLLRAPLTLIHFDTCHLYGSYAQKEMGPAKELPAWHRRVRALEEALEDVGEYLDEDLSDLEVETDADDGTTVERCEIRDHVQTAGCPSPDASLHSVYDEDCLSERPYDGPDADDHYHLKKLCKERKRDLVEAKEEFEYKKKCCLDKENVIVKKIQGGH